MVPKHTYEYLTEQGRADWAAIQALDEISKTEAIAVLASLEGVRDSNEVRMVRGKVRTRISRAQADGRLPLGESLPVANLLKWAWFKYPKIQSEIEPPFEPLSGVVSAQYSQVSDPELPKRRKDLENLYIELWHRCCELEKKNRHIPSLKKRIAELEQKIRFPGAPRKTKS